MSNPTQALQIPADTRANSTAQTGFNPENHVKCEPYMENTLQIPCGEATEIEPEAIEVQG